MSGPSSETDRETTPPGESRVPTSFRTTDRSSGLQGVGLIIGGLLFAVGLSVYGADSHSVFEAATVLLLAAAVLAILFPYYIFRDGERDV
jgi:hypothetical protein